MKPNGILACALCLALPGQAIAQAGMACVPRADAEAMFTAMLPDMLETMHAECSTRLPSHSALALRALEQADRYRPAARASRATAESVVQRVIAAGEDIELPPAMRELLGLDMFTAALQATLAQAMGGDGCRTADRFFAAIEPLPAENLAALVTIFFEMGVEGDAADGAPFHICEARES